MQTSRIIARMENFAKVLPAVVAGVADDEARWKPNEQDWSILEVVRHLADEEVEDYRERFRITIHEPETSWPPIDPQKAAIDRKYNEGDVNEAVAAFVKNRTESVAWLRSLTDLDLTIPYEHPAFGNIYAGDMLASWSGHDALHLRQISKRMYQLTHHQASPWSMMYAGTW